MSQLSDVLKYFWRLENFCFCDFDSNARLYSPAFAVRKPFPCKWSLYMFPNGHGIDKDIGIFLQRAKRDCGPKEIRVRFKISLQDDHGILYPETPDSLEKNFTKGCEWGHNEFIKRSEIATGSIFLSQDALTVVCQITNIEQNLPQTVPRRQLSLQHGEAEEIKNICKALNLLHEDNLHSDMILGGHNRTFNVHRCILSARLPDLYRKLQNSPNRVFSDDFLTEKILSYAYSGKLDIEDFTPFNINRALDEYGLFHLETNLNSQCNEYFALTYFSIATHSHSWKISTVLLREEQEIKSPFISDGFKKTAFSVYLVKIEDVWKVKIRPFSSTNDEVFIRCHLSIKDSSMVRMESVMCEHLCRSNAWWICPFSMRIQNNDLIFNNQACPLDTEFFDMDFVLTYPSGRFVSDLRITTSNHTSISDLVIDDVPKLLMELEELYYNQIEADFTVVAGNRQFKVHKCLLCARSPYFRAMFQHDMAEKKENKVHLKNDDLDDETYQEVIDKLLLFTYCGKFEAQSPTFANLLLESIDMYMIGKDYEDI